MICVFFLFFQVGSFNYDAEKMVFRSEFVPDEKESIKSILDYSISINKLRDDQTHYMALGMNYSVTGFEMILQRKMSFYIVTYYLPSGIVIILFLGLNPLGFFKGKMKKGFSLKCFANFFASCLWIFRNLS